MLPSVPPDTTSAVGFIDMIDQLPELPGGGGTAAIVRHVQALLEIPDEVREGRVDGRLYISFVVEADGSLSRAKVIRNLSPACDAAAIKALRRLPRFVSGRQNERPVAVPLTFPVSFYGPNHVCEAHEVTQKARFPSLGVRAYIRKNLRRSAAAQEIGRPGIVEVSYVVGADGRVRQVHLDGTTGDLKNSGPEIVRAVHAMPTWRPAYDAQGQAVATRAYVQVSLVQGKITTGYPAVFKPQSTTLQPNQK